MRPRTAALLTAPLLTFPLLTGCGSFPGNPTPVTTRGITMSGRVHGGQQMVTGAHLYLLAAGTGGYGASSTSLLTAGDGSDSTGIYVLTDAYGSFSITGDYTCPSAGTEVYLLATGGNPGLAPGVQNPALSLIAALGSCGNLTSATYITLNEVSTVASVYALAGFMTDATHVSSSGTPLAVTGVANAFATVANLETLASGIALATTPAVPGYDPANGLSANGIVPQSTINTLANIVSACVNSDGSTTACSTLLSTATSDGAVGGTAPTETATALLNIAHHPGVNVSTLYNLVPSTPPFQPTLSSAPNDLTLSLVFNAPSFYGLLTVAIDPAGNLWIPSPGDATLTELSPSGVVLTGTQGIAGGGLYAPMSAAVSPSGDVWVGNSDGSVSRFTQTGSPVSGAPYATSLSSISSTAFGTAGNIWALDQTGQTAKLSPTGLRLAATGPSPGGSFNYGVMLAPNTAGGAFVADSMSSLLYSVSSTGAISSFTGGGLSAPNGASVDGGGNVWVANATGSLSVFTAAGVALSPVAGYTGGGLNLPYYAAIDGSGRAWVANEGGSGISAFSAGGTPLSPALGYQNADSVGSLYLAIDGSGNLWLPDQSFSLVEYIGVASPVSTPMLPGTRGVLP